MDTVRVTQEYLMREVRANDYIGTTVDYKRRAGELEPEFRGKTMYYAPTDNMRLAKNRLWQVSDSRSGENMPRTSDRMDEEGYVFIIPLSSGTPEMKTERVTQADMERMIRQDPYVGTTVDVQRRAREHGQKPEFRGKTMYYAPTDNMRSAENRLLQMCRSGCPENTQRTSNRADEKGFIYIIV